MPEQPVLDDFHPTIEVSATFNGEKDKKVEVNLGNIISPSDVKNAPVVQFTALDSTLEPDVVYTLILTDPDAPTRSNPEWSEYCHWIITNVTLGSDKVPHPINVVDYYPPGPPPNTAQHRYVFVFLRPKDPHAEPINSGPVSRRRWGHWNELFGIRGWAKENGLEPVGEYLCLGADAWL